MAADAGASKTAVIVGLLGAGCYPLSLLGAMLGLRAFLSLSAPGTPGRGLAIVAMLMPGLILPVTLLEGLAVKTPMRRAAAAKLQPECRQQLAKFWAAEEKFHDDHGRYTEDRDDLGVTRLPEDQRYSYLFGATGWLVPNDETAKSHLTQLKRLDVPLGERGDTFTIACVTQVKDWVDVWTVSSEDREFEGGKVVLPAGTPHNDYSGYAK